MRKACTAHILTLIVDNEFGVLTRITAQIRREGWNIQTLDVAECLEPTLSRITLSLECFDTTLPNVIHRLSKLACVRSVTAYDDETQLCWEMMIVGLKAGTKWEDLSGVAIGGKLLREHNGKFYYECSGTPWELTEAIKILSDGSEVDIVRTGPVVLEYEKE